MRWDQRVRCQLRRQLACHSHSQVDDAALVVIAFRCNSLRRVDYDRTDVSCGEDRSEEHTAELQAPTEISTLSLHDALPISPRARSMTRRSSSSLFVATVCGVSIMTAPTSVAARTALRNVSSVTPVWRSSNTRNTGPTSRQNCANDASSSVMSPYVSASRASGCTPPWSGM